MTIITATQIDKPPPRRRWPDWIGDAAAAWAAGYAVVALVWTVTGRGFPFGQEDPEATGLLRELPAGTGAPVFAGVLVATAVAALAMAGGQAGAERRLPRLALAGFGWLVAGTLLVVVPEFRVLALAGYAPMLIFGAPFGWPPEVDYAEVFSWPLINQVFSILGGFLVAGTVLAWHRRIRSACGACGRGGVAARWTTPAAAETLGPAAVTAGYAPLRPLAAETLGAAAVTAGYAPLRPLAAARWGRWAVYVAAAVPLLYAVTRIAWALGIPLTVTEEFLEELHADGAHWAGLGLAGFALVGVVLTVGLVQRWGERFPRWMVGLAGRRVPVALAVAPASVVSVLVTSAGLALLADPAVYESLVGGEWIFLPQLFWPVWGAALAAATLAYYLRRRGRCSRCGRQ